MNTLGYLVAPTKHFALPPYSAQPSGGSNSWWFVANRDGFNCLSFPEKPGAKFTSREDAEAIADAWNSAAGDGSSTPTPRRPHDHT